MKYLAYSALIHLLMVILVTYGNGGGSAEPLSQPVSVELISKAPRAGSIKASKASKFLKNSPNKSKSLAKSLKAQTKDKQSKKTTKTDTQQDTATSQNSLSKQLSLSYTQELKLYLEKAKHYPRQAIRLKQSGVVQVKVKIDSSGNFSDIAIAKASSFPLLDKAAINLLKKLGHFKPLPGNIPPNSNFTIPIAYVMGGRK